MKLRHGTLALSILVCSGLVLAAYAQKSGGQVSPYGHSSKSKRKASSAQILRAQANWFYHQRAYPLPHIPAFARERAWTDFRQAQTNQRQFFQQKYGTNYPKQVAALAVTTAVVNPAATWTPIGPQPTNAFFNQPTVSGRVSALLVDPCDTSGNTVFLGGAQGGIWLSANGGTNWVTVGDQATLPSLAIGSLATAPAATSCSSATVDSVSTQVPNTIYVGTGEENFSLDSYYGAGVLTCKFTGGTTYYSCTPDKTLGAFNTTNPLNSAYAGPYIGGLAVDPKNSSVLLASVWGSGTALPSGIYCSADGGSTWTHYLPNSTSGEIGTAVAFDQAGYAYAAIGNIYGANLNGIYKTTSAFTSDSCAAASTFSALSNLTNLVGSGTAMGRISLSVASNPSSPTNDNADEIFAAIADASNGSSTLLGVYGSGDGGSSWTPMNDPAGFTTPTGGFCNDQCFYDIPIAIDPYNPSVVYAGGSAPGSGVNGEGNTIIMDTSASSASSSGFTINASSTWTDVAGNSSSLCTTSSPSGCLFGVHVDAHAIAFARNGTSGGASKVYVGTDGGVWSATNPESLSSFSGWNDLNATLGLTQIYTGMSNNPSGWQYRTFLGSQDNGTQVLAPDLLASYNPSNSALAWDDTLSCGDGGVTLVDPLVPSTVYGECSYIPGFILGIEKSLFNGDVQEANGSSTFYEASTGIDSNDDGSFVPPLAIDPEATGSTGDAQTLYFGTYRVWQTTDGGANWSAISPDVSGASAVPYCTENNDANIANCVLTALAVAPTDSNEVITGSSVGHIFATANAGQGASASWTDITTSNLPGRDITQVAVDPRSPSTLYATFSGFSTCAGCDQLGHVYIGTLTTAGGVTSANWTNISSGSGCVSPAGNLPDIPVNSIVVDPNVAGQLFIGTDVGVYMGTLQGTAPAVTGACWQPLGTGLPNSAVLSLSLNNASRTLIAGTHGRSAWAYSLGDVPAFALTSLSPASTAVESSTGSGITLTLGGNGFSSPTVNWTVNGKTPSGCTVVATAKSSTQFTASVPATCLESSALAEVSVTESTPPATSTDCNGKTNSTNCLAFTITDLTPTVNSINPITGTSGNPLNLTLTGTNFASNTSVGLQTEISALPCSPRAQASGGTSTTISASIPGSCLQYGGIFYVTANNPSPGGGSSNPNLVAAASPYGTACSSMSPPGCLLTVTGAAPSNDNFANAAPISTSSYSDLEDTSGATTDGPSLLSVPCIANETAAGYAAPPDNGDAKSVWFKYTPSANVVAEIDTIGSSYDTILSVWTGTSSSLSSVACNDDIASGTNRVSQITNLGLSANTTYYFMVSTFGVSVLDGSGNLAELLPDGGKLAFHMSTSPAPTFTATAGSLTPTSVSAGSSATFKLTVTGSSSSASGTVSLLPCTTSPSTTTITCSYSSSSLSVGPSSSSSSTVTISTTAAAGGIPPAGPFQSPPIGWIVVVLAAFSMLAFVIRRRVTHGRVVSVRSGLAAALGFAVVAGVLLFSAACGGGGPSVNISTGATPSGTYTITVPISPTSSNGNPSVKLTVQ